MKLFCQSSINSDRCSPQLSSSETQIAHWFIWVSWWLTPPPWGDRVRLWSQYWTDCDRMGMCSTDHQDSALSSSVISYAADSDRWSLLYGWRRGSINRNLWPGRTVWSHGIHRWMPCHRLLGGPGQVSKMMINSKNAEEEFKKNIFFKIVLYNICLYTLSHYIHISDDYQNISLCYYFVKAPKVTLLILPQIMSCLIKNTVIFFLVHITKPAPVLSHTV